jgi:tetratricopeptide (TPR) repeat protein
LIDIGASYDTIQDFEKALGYYERSMKMLTRYHKGAAHPDTAVAISNIGVVYENLKDFEKALEYYYQALEMRKTIYHGDMQHPDIVMSLNTIKSLR